MIFNGTEVRTPFENPIHYDVDWRYQIARIWSDDPTINIDPDVAADMDIVNLRDTMIRMSNGISVNDDPIAKRLKIALDWYTSDGTRSPRRFIEPLLLTGATFDVITRDIGGKRVPESVFKTYERLFFNVRDDDGTVTDSCYLRSFAALPDGIVLDKETPDVVVWRVAAVQTGYTGLVRLWNWRDYHGAKIVDVDLQRELVNMAQAIIMNRILRGSIGSFDLNTIFANYIQYERLRQDVSSAESKPTSAEGMLLKVLDIMKPKIITAAQSADEFLALNAQLRSRLEAQQAIQAQQVRDKGLDSSLNQLNATLEAHFNQIEAPVQI
jgi:hypothetical protein